MELNVVIAGSPWTERDLELLFDGPDGPPEPFTLIEARDMPNLMVRLGCFKSTGEARRAGRVGSIPQGFTLDFKANKKTRICIWNPTE